MKDFLAIISVIWITVTIVQVFVFDTRKCTKEVRTIEICDTLNMEKWYYECTNEFRGVKDYDYKKECGKDAREVFCKKVKFIVCVKNGDIIEMLACSLVVKKSDIKLCEN